jgi:hypothetical protein
MGVLFGGCRGLSEDAGAADPDKNGQIDGSKDPRESLDR